MLRVLRSCMFSHSLGHEERFPPPRLNGHCRFRKRSSALAHTSVPYVDERWRAGIAIPFSDICPLPYPRPLRPQFSKSSSSRAMRLVCGSLS